MPPLRENRWADFARGYNGSAYAANRYDRSSPSLHQGKPRHLCAGTAAAADHGTGDHRRPTSTGTCSSTGSATPSTSTGPGNGAGNATAGIAAIIQMIVNFIIAPSARKSQHDRPSWKPRRDGRCRAARLVKGFFGSYKAKIILS
jgi:hypothetical protein